MENEIKLIELTKYTTRTTLCDDDEYLDLTEVKNE